MSNPFYTIGHSTRSIAEFTDLLVQAGVETVVDVRTVPRSRTNPQFNRDTLPETLSQFQVGYEHVSALGGLRKKCPQTAPEVNALWRVQSFHNFADYALGAPFRCALTELRVLGGGRRCAIMCAEAMWWRCHRRIIADYLIAAGERVLHIVANKRIEPARMTEGAMVHPDGTVTYPAQGGDLL
jgi:uncharacterized protein (DUF488 family)